MIEPTLREFISIWLRTKKLEVKPATYNRLQTPVHALGQYPIMNLKLGEITTADVQDYLASLVGFGYSYSTIKKQLEIISAPIRNAYEQRMIPFNPCLPVKLPHKANVKKQQKEIMAYTQEEQAALYRAFTKVNHEAKYLIGLMLESGLRAGEGLALKWNDVNLEKRMIRVHATVLHATHTVQEGAKSVSSNCIVPLSANAIQLLNELRERKEKDAFLFHCLDGSPLTYESLLKCCKRLCREAEIPYYGLHAFRHTFATNQYYKGTDIKILSKMLGHAGTAITYNTYIHLYNGGLDEMLKAVD